VNKTVKIIYNPSANKGNAGKLLPRVEVLLKQSGIAYELVLTTAPGDAHNIAKQAAEDGCALVVAAGGDGTVNEVINGLMQANVDGNGRPVLAVLPIGRGNDFAYGVDIPHELEEAVEVLVQDQSHSLDVGKVTGGDYPEGRYFGNGVGLGFDTVVGFEAAKVKWLHGAASYLLALIRTIFLYSKAPVYEIKLDNETFHQPFLMVSVMNGRRMGGSFYMAPDGDASDGVFDLCLASHVPQLRILPLAAKFISGTQKGHPAIRMLRSHKVTIRATEGTIPAHADGETICEAGKSLSIELFPDSLKVLSRKNGNPS